MKIHYEYDDPVIEYMNDHIADRSIILHWKHSLPFHTSKYSLLQSIVPLYLFLLSENHLTFLLFIVP